MGAGADDIQALVEKLHVPHPSRGGVDAIIADLDPKVKTTTKSCMSRTRSCFHHQGERKILPSRKLLGSVAYEVCNFEARFSAACLCVHSLVQILVTGRLELDGIHF